MTRLKVNSLLHLFCCLADMCPLICFYIPFLIRMFGNLDKILLHVILKKTMVRSLGNRKEISCWKCCVIVMSCTPGNTWLFDHLSYSSVTDKCDQMSGTDNSHCILIKAIHIYMFLWTLFNLYQSFVLTCIIDFLHVFFIKSLIWRWNQYIWGLCCFSKF